MRNNFFASKLFTILASIFFAVILFFNASSAALRNQGNSTTGEVYTTTISNVPIEIKYNSDEYFASGYNNTANVYLTSYNRVQINTEENPDSRNFYLVVDLSNAKEGTVTMPVRIQQLPNGINAQIEPTTLTVRLEKKASAEFNVTPLIEQAQLPDGFKVNDIKLSQEKVKVTAGETSIKQIHAIQAALPSDAYLNDDYSGTVTLHAVDADGKLLPAQISPATVQMKVSVEKPSKTVPVNVKKTGTLDQSLSDMKTSLSQKTVTISGEQSALDKINSVDATVNISNITEKETVNVDIQADGASVKPSQVEVRMTPVKK